MAWIRITMPSVTAKEFILAQPSAFAIVPTLKLN
jgi:hypothetical protein